MQQHYKKELKIPKNIKEACEVLGINGKLIQRKINKAYRKLALVYHPDKCSGSCKNSSNSNMQALSQAKTLLINELENIKKYNKKAFSKRESETSKTECDNQDVKPTIANSFINKNLERARKLIKQKGKNIPLALFVKNACEDNRWCQLFEEFLLKWSDEIDLNTNVIVVSDTFEGIKCTVLYYACIKRSRSVVELLLKHKADVNRVSYHSYKVPICFALKNNDHNLASLLFQHGARIDVITEVEQKIIDNSYSQHSKYTKKTIEVLLQYISPEQNAKILKRFLDSNSSTNEDIEIIQLLNKGTNLNYGTIQTAIANQLFLTESLTIMQKEDTAQYDEETTIPLTMEDRPKKLNPIIPLDYIKNQERKIEVNAQDADVNNNQVIGKSSQNTQTTSSKIYIIVGCGIGVVIAYLAGAAALIPILAAVAVFIAAAVIGALAGYGVSKFCKKVSRERQKNSIGTAIEDVSVPECFKSQKVYL